MFSLSRHQYSHMINLKYAKFKSNLPAWKFVVDIRGLCFILLCCLGFWFNRSSYSSPSDFFYMINTLDWRQPSSFLQLLTLAMSLPWGILSSHWTSVSTGDFDALEYKRGNYLIFVWTSIPQLPRPMKWVPQYSTAAGTQRCMQPL